MSEPAKPHFLIVGINKRVAVNNSNIGSTQDNIVALIPINGDWLNPHCSYPDSNSRRCWVSIFLSSTLCTTDFRFLNGL